MRKTRATAAVMVSLALIAAGCGDDDEDPASGDTAEEATAADTATAAETAEDTDTMDLIEAVMDFHMAIASQSRHELLMSQLETLQTQTRRLIFYTKLFQSDPLSEVDSHRALLEALRGGDTAEVERVIYTHHMDSADRLIHRMDDLEARRHGGKPAERTAVEVA